jgi:hypothetical protein
MYLTCPCVCVYMCMKCYMKALRTNLTLFRTFRTVTQISHDLSDISGHHSGKLLIISGCCEHVVSCACTAGGVHAMDGDIKRTFANV